MTDKSVVRWWAAAMGCVLAIGLVLAVPAQARVRSDVPAAPAATLGGALAQVLDPSGVEAYWTADRMRSALPLGLDELGNLITSPRPPAPSVAARASLTAPRSVGKLFFSDGASDFVCSASAINTAEKNVIITAGHCASTGGVRTLLGCSKGRYFTNFLFVPRYTNGSAPDGRWVGTRAITHRQWLETCDNFEFDQALIEVAPRNGRNLVRVVGGNGLAWNYPAREEDIRVWGWPAEAPYDGETVRRCTGNTSSFNRTPDAKIECPLTGGASGGPWFIAMVNSDVGFVWAVTSRRTITGTPYLLAYPLGDSIRTLLSNARANRAVARTTARALSRSTITLRAIPQHVGRGQLLRLRSRTSASTRVVLEVRLRVGGPWRLVDVKRTGSDGIVEFKHRPSKVGLRWYRVRTTSARETVRVRVHACPLPATRTRDVIDATACTAPAG